MVREIVTLSVGQAGVQLSNAVWELYCIEHGVSASGNYDFAEDPSDLTYETLFNKSARGNMIPRVCILDLEPTVIDEIRVGTYRNLYHPDYLINGIEDAANNFARGQFTIGRQKLSVCMEKIRKLAMECENLQGFVLLHGVGGGTGSGFCSTLLQRLNEEYAKNYRFAMTVLPGPELSSIVVEPYNVALASNPCIEDCDLNICADNEACYQICKDGLNYARPTFNNVNRVIAQIVSSFTSSSRFDSCLSSDLTQLQTNLVPFPKIHFPTASYAPIISAARGSHEMLSTSALTRSVFERSNQLASVSPLEGRFMAINLQFKGSVSPAEVNEATSEMKSNNSVKFVNWCPTGYKIGISRQPPVAAPSSFLVQSERNVAMFANNSCLSVIWRTLETKFDKLFAKRAFVHWYVGEGMEEGEFNDAKATIQTVADDYEELGKEEDNDEGESEKLDNSDKKKTSSEKQNSAEEEYDYGGANDDNDDERSEADEVTDADGYDYDNDQDDDNYKGSTTADKLQEDEREADTQDFATTEGEEEEEEDASSSEEGETGNMSKQES